MKTFEKLLLGSAEINRMLAAINQITKSTLGALDPNKAEEVNPITIPSGQHHEWRLHRILIIRKNQPSENRWALEFYELGSYDQPPFRLIYSTNPVNQREPALEDMQDTYWALEELVDYFMSHFTLRVKLNPLLLAAATARFSS